MKNYVSKIYENREKFIIIGLTGKTGSGCTTISKILEGGYKDYNEVDCNDKPINNRKNSMKRIVYIEAYPDISNEQVFDIGSQEIEMVHFRGAIGLAYQKLYEPIFSYKELKALNTKKEIL